MKPKHLEKIIKYVTKHGYPHDPAYLPDGVIRGRTGDCFDCSIINALRNKELRYVEGIAKNPQTGEWMYHAWLTDKGGNAYDPTWKLVKDGEDHPVPTEYIGIEMDTEDVATFMQATEYKAVLENGWRDPETANAALANQGLPDLWDC